MRTRKHGKKNFSSRPIVTIYVDHVHENKETKENMIRKECSYISHCVHI